jgi:response regulator RpfG family c-di-GMP phosphodiesterase
LIFVDVQIKPMSAQLFAAETRKLYKDHPNPRIVAMTDLIEHCPTNWSNEDIDTYVCKPIKTSELQKIIGGVFE